MQAANFEARQLRELHKSRAYEKCKCKFTVHEKGELIVAANQFSPLHKYVARFYCKRAMTSGVDAVEQADTLCLA